MILETLYECIEQNANLNGISEQNYDRNIACLGNHGLFEMKDGKLTSQNSLSYCNEYDTVENKKK